MPYLCCIHLTTIITQIVSSHRPTAALVLISTSAINSIEEKQFPPLRSP